jgi:hypothetical protein
MIGDILQDRYGWFFRDNGDGSADDLSGPRGGTVPTADIDTPVVLVRNGAPVPTSNLMASRVAVVLSRRYEGVAR